MVQIQWPLDSLAQAAARRLAFATVAANLSIMDKTVRSNSLRWPESSPHLIGVVVRSHPNF